MKKCVSSVGAFYNNRHRPLYHSSLLFSSTGFVYLPQSHSVRSSRIIQRWISCCDHHQQILTYPVKKKERERLFRLSFFCFVSFLPGGGSISLSPRAPRRATPRAGLVPKQLRRRCASTLSLFSSLLSLLFSNSSRLSLSNLIERLILKSREASI